MPATSRINEVRELIQENLEQYRFELNDETTWLKVRNRFNYILMQESDVVEVAVVCDETNNTPERIEELNLFVDIAVCFDDIAEFFYFPVCLSSVVEE